MPQGTWQVSNFIEGKQGQAFSGLLASGICSKNLFNMHGCTIFIGMFPVEHWGRNRKASANFVD